MVGGLMYLVDTNIWLELLLEQEKAPEVRHFLEVINPATLYITEFAFYSIGIILLGLKKAKLLIRFVRDTVLDAGVNLVRFEAKDIEDIVIAAQKFNLDFDDAYQYTVAEKYNLKIISFDSDFDRTKRGRITPDKI